MNRTIALILAMVLLLCACAQDGTAAPSDRWRTYYEIFVRSFRDSNDDGIGDLKGVLEKFDYLNDGDINSGKSLHIGGIWLMPVMPSPTYHKYDVTDYYAIDPQYGTMADFEALAAKCRSRDVTLIMDLVLNHTSSQHPWFQSASVSAGIPPCGKKTCKYKELCREHNPYCKYYNFSSQPQTGFAQVPLYGNLYYECRFWSGMPDLNLDEPMLRAEIVKIMKFWLEKGAGGFRLDAVTSFYTGNNAKNKAFLAWLKTEASKIDEKAYLVGEAWAAQDVIKELYAGGIDSLFNFPFSQFDGLFIPAVRSEDGSAVAQRIEAWQRDMLQISPHSIDAVFLSNHDNGRSAGMLNRDIELEKSAAALYILTPGNAFIYYGEELGMTGSGRDENKRLPMLWSATDKTGIPFPPPNAEFFEQPAQGVEEQLADKNSLLNYYIKLIGIKNRTPEIARGTVKSIDTGTESIVAFSSEYNGSVVFVLHNLAAAPVSVTLPKDSYSYKKIAEYLGASGGKAKMKGGSIEMPARSTVILK